MNDKGSGDARQVLAQAYAFHQQGELARAKTAYLKVLALDRDQAPVLHLLGLVEHQLGDAKSAIACMQQSLSLDANQPMVWNNLANVYFAAGHVDEAIRLYSQATKLSPDYADAHRNLANAQAKGGQVEASVASYQRALQLHPDDVTSHLGLARLLEAAGQLEAAVNSYRNALAHQSDCAVACSRMGKLLGRLGRPREAREAFQTWARIEPGNPIAQHLLAAHSPDAAPVRASDAYVKSTFDQFAETFDQSLSRLDYRVPDLIYETLEQVIEPAKRGHLRVVDLGCGTGLCSPHLRELASRLVGVDLSSGMLAKAEERGCYDELVEAELTDYLAGRVAEFDLIVSADTFVYIGQLEPVFDAAHAALAEGGRIVFTAEKRTTPPTDSTSYQLDRSGAMHTVRPACGIRWRKPVSWSLAATKKSFAKKRESPSWALLSRPRNAEKTPLMARA